MPKIHGDGTEETNPEEQQRLAQQREAQADAMKPENKTTLEVWHNGTKYTMPYLEFVKKYGNPKDYTPASLIKTIVKYDLQKGMGF